MRELLGPAIVGLISIVAILGFFALAPEGSAALDLWPFERTSVPLVAIFFVGLALGIVAGFVAGLRSEAMFYDSPVARAGTSLQWLLAVALCAILLWGVRSGTIEPIRAILILICGVFAIVAGALTIASLARGEAFRLDRHWGIGGEAGGWRASPNVILMLVALIFVGATFASATLAVEPARAVKELPAAAKAAPQTPATGARARPTAQPLLPLPSAVNTGAGNVAAARP